jgi:hypothetical protein
MTLISSQKVAYQRNPFVYQERTMTKKDYSLSISAPVSASDAYGKIARVSEWWATDFEGSARSFGDVFTVRFGRALGETFVDFQVTEAVPGRKVVWHVTNCFLPWLQDKTEWNGTEVVFEVSSSQSGTTVTLTHKGLVPEVECFDRCVQGWNQFFGQSFRQFLADGHGMPG